MNIASNVIDAIVSDHKAMEWELTNIQPILRKSIKVENKKLARMVSEQALYGAYDTKEFLEKITAANIAFDGQAYFSLDSRKIERRLFFNLVTSNGDLTNNIIMKY